MRNFSEEEFGRIFAACAAKTGVWNALASHCCNSSQTAVRFAVGFRGRGNAHYIEILLETKRRRRCISAANQDAWAGSDFALAKS
jgi:hypothetical protein